MKHKKRLGKWERVLKERLSKNLTYKLLIISLLILVLFFAVLTFIDFSIKKEVKKGLEGKLISSSPIPFGKEPIEQALLIESSMHSGVSLIEEANGYIIELKSLPFFKNRAGGITYKQQIREEHIVLKQ